MTKIPNISYVNTFKNQTKISWKIMSCTNCGSLQASPIWCNGKRPEDQIVLLKILKFECPVLSGPNTYTQSGRALKNQTKLSWKLILCTTFCSGLAYMMQWKKGGGPNCAIENLAKCNNPRDLPHNSDLIKCNWDLAMSLQCPKSFL